MKTSNYQFKKNYFVLLILTSLPFMIVGCHITPSEQAYNRRIIIFEDPYVNLTSDEIENIMSAYIENPCKSFGLSIYKLDRSMGGNPQLKSGKSFYLSKDILEDYSLNRIGIEDLKIREYANSVSLLPNQSISSINVIESFKCLSSLLRNASSDDDYVVLYFSDLYQYNVIEDYNKGVITFIENLNNVEMSEFTLKTESIDFATKQLDDDNSMISKAIISPFRTSINDCKLRLFRLPVGKIKVSQEGSLGGSLDKFWTKFYDKTGINLKTVNSIQEFLDSL